ncbi:MAG: type IV pili twitching motility protein PilT [Deltaproteobacteria bacterium GWC2_42_51]|nr:MAG: type IV pili twitching motility protein PilT [Deltaproteobacteria bacterium GWA2_42_85]OGP26994.1 MAG: type IV pili twitching motility protein PilT [Deltaproteobacteria bacterium GWB2_42_7]OGP34870.1 MAG: type IV pili twitching motility protein PilT [Deltaproteobacteria bacterium GWC2_42_51]OGP42554.1 MAG: type IV pili twitching motility protein PilT [Deltaproteobacteria bacterium GWD2_42_10]OGP46929.1 MAG: type IV pili twitching motility protein PilT [Deltaproteobacteria bacterium GWF2
MELHDILNLSVKEKASDVHLKAGLPPILRIYGNLIPVKNQERLAPDEITKIAMRLMNDQQKEVFKTAHQVDMAYSVPGLGRFRVNIFQQRGATGIVFRVIPVVISSVTELNLPKILEKVSGESRGLVLVTGVTGSGKSTTIASMLDYINNHFTYNIITVEDPIEFLHRDKKCIINQREIGVDTRSFSESLRSALRQDPDIIMVGEMRDLETIEIALMAAETGHLVMSTLHTIDAMETINRIVSVFPPYQQKQIRIQLASVIRGIISLRLIPTKDGKGRVPAVEVLVSTGRIRECIEDKEKTKDIRDAIAKGQTTYGMQTFDQSIMDLLNKGFISYEEALAQASNPDDFALRVKGVTATSDEGWKEFEGAKEKETAKKKEEHKIDIERF